MSSLDLLPDQFTAPEILDELAIELSQVSSAARQLDLDPDIALRLRYPARETTHNLVVRENDRDARNVQALIVEHTTDGHSCIPLILDRQHHNRVRAEALRRALQAALLNIRICAAAAAINLDPQELTEHQLHSLVRQISSRDTNFGPSYLMNQNVASWLLASGAFTLGRATSPRAIIQAHWILECIRRFGQLDLRNATVALQGFDAHAQHLASLLTRAGAKLIAVSDNSGGLYDRTGLDLVAIQQHRTEHRMLAGYPAAEPVTNADLLATPCDVLILMAAEHQITPANATQVRANVILEFHPRAIASECLSTLKNSVVLPSLLSTAGTLLADFAELTTPLPDTLTEPRCRALVRRIIAPLAHRLRTTMQPTLLESCYFTAVERLADSLRWHNQ
jgi:glutamate dehydrogenase (NAD(P)+)